VERVTRIHLKTSGESRKELIDFCLNSEKQYVAIGWSGAFETNPSIKSYEDYYYAVKERYNCRADHSHNVFWNAKPNDLFWTRDLDGIYWICRATDKAMPMYIPKLDIGAVVPVCAYKYGLEVPGQIKASFNRPRGGVCQDFKDEIIIEFSKSTYNEKSGTAFYEIKPITGNLLDNLPDFELEELVISFIQLHEDYYLLSNSIAKKSTTIKIECELIHRNKNRLKKAVVQVKGGRNKCIDALDYKSYDDAGYMVYLYAPHIVNLDKLKNAIYISREQLLSFYKDYKSILPDSITKWEII
jgi:hypothetical protein